MKSCIQVWKSRNLTYIGKTLIVKNLIISLSGYEIEIRGIPDKYRKEIITLIWSFIWGGKVNQIERNVCCINEENGGMGMINFDEFIDSKYIKLIYRIINEPIDSWNAIGKYWLRKLDIKYNESYFICKCSDVSQFNINYYSKFYREAIHAWSKILCNQNPTTRNDLLNWRLIGNSTVKFQNRPLTFNSFSKSDIKFIKDIWDENNNNYINCNELFAKLTDKRNCISEYSRVKKAIPKEIFDILNKTKQIESGKTSNIKLSIDLRFVNKDGREVDIKKIKLKDIQHNLKKEFKPKCQGKWDEIYTNISLNWKTIWQNLKMIHIFNKVKEFQWKCVHNIVYTESRLFKMKLSNGICHLCKNRNLSENLSHLFFKCVVTKQIVREIQHLINIINTDILVIEEQNMMFGFNEGNVNENNNNVIIFLSKYSLWKVRNKIKYENLRLNTQTIVKIWKQIMITHFRCLLKAKCSIEKNLVTRLLNYFI